LTPKTVLTFREHGFSTLKSSSQSALALFPILSYLFYYLPVSAGRGQLHGFSRELFPDSLGASYFFVKIKDQGSISVAVFFAPRNSIQD